MTEAERDYEPTYTGVPRWVKILLIVAVIVIVVLATALLLGGEHGPGL